MDFIERISKRVNEIKQAGKEVRNRVKIARADEIVLNGSICAVDGGLAVIRAHGFDICISRAIGVKYTFDSGNLSDVEYYPDAYVEPDITYFEHDIQDSSKLENLERLKKEISTGLKVGKDCDLLLMDGSLFPQPQDKVESDDYQDLLGKYEKLVGRQNTVGVVEDTRSKRYARLLGYEMLDTVLLGHALSWAEYTSPVRYTEDPKKHFILKDFDPRVVEKVSVFYIKPAPYDTALRVEFNNTMDVEKLANTIFTLAKSSGDYGYPSIILEADARAKIKQVEVRRVYQDIIDAVMDSSVMQFRRERRLVI